MNVSNTKSLIDLFFNKLEEINSSKSFLQWLKAGHTHQYSWNEVSERIFKLTNKIQPLINEGDRCLLLSENRPEWLIADIAIMNAGGISVPIFTTYSDNDYKYIIDDCKPTIIIVSNQTQFKKIKNYISGEIKLIISFEKLEHESMLINDIYKEIEMHQ